MKGLLALYKERHALNASTRIPGSPLIENRKSPWGYLTSLLLGSFRYDYQARFFTGRTKAIKSKTRHST